MAYEVEIQHKAAKQIMKLPRHEQRRVARQLDELAIDPRPSGCVKMSGTNNSYRVRFGDYRILYTIDDGIRVISIERVAHRREAYR